jgi:hypothetical protein
MTDVEKVIWAILGMTLLVQSILVARNTLLLDREYSRAMDLKDALIATLTHQRDVLRDDHANPNRDAIYKHDLHALLKDGAKDGCHTDVGTALRERLVLLLAVADAANEWRGTYGVDCTRAGRALCAAVDAMNNTKEKP